MVIPAEVRRRVGIAPGDDVVVEARKGEVVVRKRRGILEFIEETGGLQTPKRLKGKPDKEIMRGAREWRVEERRRDR